MRTRRDEQGSVTVWMLLSVVAFVAIVGISVDLGGRMYALQRVQDIAAEAARAGTQQVDQANAMRGRTPQVDPAKARTAALEYIAAAGYAGTATVTSGNVLRVSVQGTHTPMFLTAATATVSGEAEARLVRAQNGTER